MGQWLRKYWRTAVVFFTFIIIIALAVYVAYISSINENVKTSIVIVNKTLFSQYLGVIATFAALFIALFIKNIQSFMDTTDIIINNNLENEKIIEFSDEHFSKVRLKFHLIIKNIRKKSTVNDCMIFIEPKEDFKELIDVPKAFIYSGTEHTKKNITDFDYIDFAILDIDFVGKKPKATLKILIEGKDNHNYTDIFNESNCKFILTVHSRSITKRKYYLINFVFNADNINTLIEGWFNKRQDYIKEHKWVDDMYENFDDFDFNQILNEIEIHIKDFNVK